MSRQRFQCELFRYTGLGGPKKGKPTFEIIPGG